MIEQLSLYSFSLLAGLVSSLALSLLGIQLLARDRAVESLCTAQGASLGTICALSLGGTLVASYISALLFAFLALVFCLQVERSSLPKGTSLVAFFAVLSSGIHLSVALSPAVEMHSTQAFFGDIVTLSEKEALLSLALFSVIFLLLCLFFKKISRITFERVVLKTSKFSRLDLLFNILSLCTISCSVIFLGMLFTIAHLFIPALFLRFFGISGLFKNVFAACVISSFSLGAGFFVSLIWDEIPTVPAIILAQVVVSCLLGLLQRAFNFSAHRSAQSI